ncbi:MAG TPA: hypothetical protein VG711_03745, partial [Phycisphaerales bacterium]|nr:hypothetical protein [Phycisphaerales bacterium]
MAQNQSGRAHKIFALCAMASCAAWPWLVANAPGSGRLSDDPPAQTQPNSDATQPNVDDPAASQPQTATTLRKEPGALASDGQAFTIGGFDLRYLRQHPQHPAIAELLKTDVDLGWTYQGYVAPREGVPTVRISVGDAENRETEVYYASALQHVLEALRDRLNKDFGLMGVYVAPDPKDVDASGNDLRAPSDRVMNIVISTAIVTDMRTLASGERVSEDGPITPEDRIDNPVHRRILLRSPIQPFIPPTDVANKSILEANKDDAARAARADLLNKNTLDDYLYFLSRHPGRRVDA